MGWVIDGEKTRGYGYSTNSVNRIECVTRVTPTSEIKKHFTWTCSRGTVLCFTEILSTLESILLHIDITLGKPFLGTNPTRDVTIGPLCPRC